MNHTLARCGLGLCGVVLLVSGCGMPDMTSLKEKLTKDKDTTVAKADTRTDDSKRRSVGSDGYDSTNPFTREKAKETPHKRSSRKADSFALKDLDDGGELGNIEGGLETQLVSLQKQAQTKKEKLAELRNRRQEIDTMIGQYDQQVDKISSEIQATERVIAVLKTDPTFFTRETKRVYGEQATAPKPVVITPPADEFVPAPTARYTTLNHGGNSAMAPAAGMRAPLPKAQVNLPSSAVATAKSGRFARPPFASAPSPVAAPTASAPAAAASQVTPTSTKILACDGKGSDTVTIIGAGAQDGVKVGNYYAVGDAAHPRAMLVVTEVYPSQARAVPIYGKIYGDISMQDTVVPVNSLP